jgi:hypothetical protein
MLRAHNLKGSNHLVENKTADIWKEAYNGLKKKEEKKKVHK